MIKERQLHINAVIFGRFTTEISGAKPFTVGPRPTAVEPRPDDKNVKYPRILFLDMLVGMKGSVKVFVVVPAADGHGRALDAVKMRENVAILPILIVVRVAHHIVPIRLADAEAFLIAVGNLFQAARL